MTTKEVKTEIEAALELKLRLESMYDDLFMELRDATEEQLDGELYEKNQQYLNLGYAITGLEDVMMSLDSVIGG